MPDNGRAKRKIQPWQARKITYGLAAVIVGVLGWVGVLSDIQADQVTDQVDKWLPILLGVLAPALAATKTNQGSDSTATDEDRAISKSYPPADLTDQVRDAAERAVRDTLSRIPGADQTAQAVLAAIRAEEKGEHDTTAGTAATATATTDYVYGR
ncbi:hypothetical protein [Corynebacterium variabile]|uniref:hypothetical protein n=1 Tax=Corynebacterium variabile TaxID=1727 RepID=UPI00289CD1ED|nr:hypothetical protein [Corynebacterium variabile]